jgi:hypothetical protein
MKANEGLALALIVTMFVADSVVVGMMIAALLVLNH